MIQNTLGHWFSFYCPAVFVMFTNINPYKHNHIPADQAFSIQQQIKQQYALQIPEVLRY